MKRTEYEEIVKDVLKRFACGIRPSVGYSLN